MSLTDLDLQAKPEFLEAQRDAGTLGSCKKEEAGGLFPVGTQDLWVAVTRTPGTASLRLEGSRELEVWRVGVSAAPGFPHLRRTRKLKITSSRSPNARQGLRGTLHAVIPRSHSVHSTASRSRQHSVAPHALRRDSAAP